MNSLATAESPSTYRLPQASLYRAVALVVAVLAFLALTSAGLPKARADDRLQFTGTLLNGGTFNGASLVGRPAVLWFWTPWCPFCNAEAPGVHQVSASHPNVAFVGIAAHADPGAMNDFATKYGLNFPIINDTDGSLWARYQVPWQPAYVFYRADGSSTFVNNPTSAMPESELADRVSALTR
ncbi:protein disulfide oxidoreductase [Mycolicibacterium sp. CBMA 234]|uniref:protein disulfide oxidoreductase n=1 Tax=Mycolicibacterium sp. CBMA 234 TaxID=1918495 RepID=UPI0012DD2DE1|nr:protein disulfide oxidoreductase [Mycolicibacterium sp. CBMA 234]